MLLASPREETSTSMLRPLLGERGKSRGYHDRRNILHRDIGTVDGYPHPLQHVDQGLRRELGLVAVAAAVQPDHQAVADQLVIPRPVETGDILDADRQGGIQR